MPIRFRNIGSRCSAPWVVVHGVRVVPRLGCEYCGTPSSQGVEDRYSVGVVQVARGDIPCRTRAVAAKDFTGRDANGVGLVRRIENMVAEIPAYCGELQHRQDFARTRTEELLAVADAPFEHEADLVGKEHELQTLTAQLHVDADSPQAHARAEEARQRLATQGRAPGWSLALNPTPALLAERAAGSGHSVQTRELVTVGVLAPGAAAGAQEVSPDLSAARDAVRLAGLSHPRSVEEQLADRRGGGTASGDGSPEWTPQRGREEERGR